MNPQVVGVMAASLAWVIDAKIPLRFFVETEPNMRIRWTVLNEDSDADGFLLEGEASFAAEMAALMRAGCPDTRAARFVDLEVIGRTESVVVAEVSAAMARWLENQIDAEVDEP